MDTLAKHRMANARCFVALVVKDDDISIDIAESRNSSLLSALLVHSTAWLRLVVPRLVGEYHDRCSSGGDAKGCADTEEKTCNDFVGGDGRGGAFGAPPLVNTHALFSMMSRLFGCAGSVIADDCFPT